MTFRQVAFIISDFSKTIVDDSIITIDHIIFLMSKYRNYILNSNYGNIKKEIGDANYQTICVDLEGDTREFCGKKNVMISKEKVPHLLTIGARIVYPPAGFMYGNIQYVNNTKFKYVGNNRYLKNIIYATIAPDGHLYITSSNCDFMYMKKVALSALFSDIEEAAKMECDPNGDCIDNCEMLDKKFPLDDSFLPILLKMCVEDIVGAAWRPKDDTNNAVDDVARFANILESYTNTYFKKMMNPKAPQNTNE